MPRNLAPTSLLHNFLSTSQNQKTSGFFLSKIENRNMQVFRSIYDDVEMDRKWQAGNRHLWSTDLLQDGLFIYGALDVFCYWILRDRVTDVTKGVNFF